MRCPNCNSEVKETDRYCPVCLYELKKIEKPNQEYDDYDDYNLDDRIQKPKKTINQKYMIASIILAVVLIAGIVLFRSVFNGSTNVTIDEADIAYTLLDSDNAEIDIMNIYDDEIEVYMENKSSKSLIFDVECISINGVTADSLSYKTLSKGSSILADLSIYFSYDVNIGDYSDIEFSIRILNSNTYSLIEEETVHIYPLGEENVTTYTRGILDTDYVLVDKENFAMTFIEEGESSSYFFYNVYLENNTDETLYFDIESVLINDIEIEDVYYGSTIYPNTIGFDELYIYKDDLEDLGINSIESMTLEIEVEDEDAHSVYYDTITLDISITDF